MVHSAPLDNETEIRTTTPEPPASIVDYTYEPTENGGTYRYFRLLPSSE